MTAALKGQEESITGQYQQYNDGPSPPEKPAIEIYLGTGCARQRQEQVVDGHSGKCQCGDDNHRAGCRDSPQEYEDGDGH